MVRDLTYIELAVYFHMNDCWVCKPLYDLELNLVLDI